MAVRHFSIHNIFTGCPETIDFSANIAIDVLHGLGLRNLKASTMDLREVPQAGGIENRFIIPGRRVIVPTE